MTGALYGNVIIKMQIRTDYDGHTRSRMIKLTVPFIKHISIKKVINKTIKCGKV